MLLSSHSSMRSTVGRRTRVRLLSVSVSAGIDPAIEIVPFVALERVWFAFASEKTSSSISIVVLPDGALSSTSKLMSTSLASFEVLNGVVESIRTRM